VATILESFDIDSPQHGKTFKIDLAEGLDTLHIEFMEVQWAPALKRQYDLAILQFFQLPSSDQTKEKWYEISGNLAVQDNHWEWRSKSSIAPGTNRRVFSLLNSGDVEAAMMVLLGERSRDQAALMLRFIKGFFEESPMLAEQIASETSDTLRLVSGCEIVASVCSARAHRGWPNALVIIDEAAHYIESEGNMSLSSLLEALRPSQSQFGSLALMLAISTPLDASGTFYELEQQATT